jgi:putative restriction endonuclease
MAKAVLTTKVSPVYDDLPENRYHFPKTYLNQVSKAVDDWIVYYEPRRSTGELSSSGGRQVYFATARVERIYPDQARSDHFYAEISNFLQFVRPVPFKEGSHYYESMLEKDDGSTNKGAFGRAVRNVSDHEYDMIWRAGFGHVIGLEERARMAPDVSEEPMRPLPLVAEERAPFLHEVPMEEDRRIVQQLVSRPFRDRAFSAAVKDAYHDTCAMTGLKIINGGGRSEVQAAHIRPVEHRGPDSVRNGIALCGTMHWMFDRGLVSIEDDYSLLLAKDRVPDTVSRLLGGNSSLIVPGRTDLQPHPQFLDYHRREIFKG